MSTIDINTRCWLYISPDSESGPCVCAQRKRPMLLRGKTWWDKRLCFLLLNNLQILYEWWGNGSFQGISGRTLGRRKTWSGKLLSTCGLLWHQVHSPDGPWTPNCWAPTCGRLGIYLSLGICKQLSQRNMVKSPPLGIGDIITIFRKFYKKIISDDLKSFPPF